MNNLYQNLVLLIGLQACVLINLLLERDGKASSEKWTVEIAAILDQRGHCDGDIVQRPTWQAGAIFADGCTSKGFGDLEGADGLGIPSIAVDVTPGPALLVFAQQLRLELGHELLSYSSDPRHAKTRGWLHSRLEELCQLAEIPKVDHRAIKQNSRTRIANKHGLSSTTHLPASVFQREAGYELLRLEMAALDDDRRVLRAALGWVAPRKAAPTPVLPKPILQKGVSALSAPSSPGGLDALWCGTRPTVLASVVAEAAGVSVAVVQASQKRRRLKGRWVWPTDLGLPRGQKVLVFGVLTADRLRRACEHTKASKRPAISPSRRVLPQPNPDSYPGRENDLNYRIANDHYWASKGFPA